MKRMDKISIAGQLTGAMFVYVFLILINTVTGEPFDWIFTLLYWNIMLIGVLIIYFTKKDRQDL